MIVKNAVKRSFVIFAEEEIMTSPLEEFPDVFAGF